MSMVCEPECNRTGPDAERFGEILQDPATYPDDADHVELIQTPLSYVALVGDVVYKVAKAVKLDFADFSTAEKRRRHAHREVELNRRLCADLYLGVVPVIRVGDAIRIDPPSHNGDEIDCAIKMRRLDQRAILSERIRRGDIAAQDMDRVADRLIVFYRAARADATMRRHGDVAHLRRATDETLSHTDRAARAGVVAPPVAVALRHFRDLYLDKHAKAFQSRVESGWIRDGHGDLRPEHICVTEKSVRVFDCAAFNDALREIDVAADIAFLAMELDQRGLDEWSGRLLKRIAVGLLDDTAPGVLPFYLFERAVVRSQVEQIRSENAGAADAERRTGRQKNRAYLRAALNYAIRSGPPLVLAVIGPVGVGKSTLAHRLHECTGWPVFCSNTVRKQIAGVPLWDRASPAARRRLYSAEMTRRTYRRLFAQAAGTVNGKRSVIVDATFWRAKQRSAFLKRVAEAGGECHFIELTTPASVTLERLRARGAEGDFASDARFEDFERLTARYKPADELPPARHQRVDGSASVDDIATEVLNRLVERRCSAAEGG